MGTPRETQVLIFVFETTSWNPTKPLTDGISLGPATSPESPYKQSVNTIFFTHCTAVSCLIIIHVSVNVVSSPEAAKHHFLRTFLGLCSLKCSIEKEQNKKQIALAGVAQWLGVSLQIKGSLV